MKKVITYGTFDLLHYGHRRLLERAKELGDYLVVGVTSDDFDKQRGKINVQQSLMERVKAVKDTGLVDEIVIEEYQGQKIDDICKYGIDIFAIGSDWEGKFDYLKQYCKVTYLPRTEGISSSEIRTKKRKIKMGLVGEQIYLEKIIKESNFVNGLEVADICNENSSESDFDKLIENVDAIYIISTPQKHYNQIKKALINHKNVLCESPITLSKTQTEELYQLAKENECVLMEALKTAYSTAYARLLLLLKGGVIGKVISVDATCTSLKKIDNNVEELERWNSISAWGPTAMLPIFQILGVNYRSKKIVTNILPNSNNFDTFTKIDFIYEDAVASLKVGKGVKSEGNLVITGTKGYIYVPAPWWKTDYFEIRYENQTDNKRYFYQLDGEGIRYELVAFTKAIQEKRSVFPIDRKVTYAISQVLEDFEKGTDVIKI